MTPARAPARPAGPGSAGFAILEALVTALALAVLAVLLLRLFARSTAVAPGAASAEGGALALESAAQALSSALRNAGSGPVSPADAVVPVLDDAPEGASLLDEAGREVRVVPGTDAFAVRGALEVPPVALDPFDRAAGEPLTAPPGSAAPGLLQRDPRAARLPLYRYPSRENPRRFWARGGLGLRWGEGERSVRPRRDDGVDLLLAALSRASTPPAPGRFFAVEDEEGRRAVARLKGPVDTSLLEACDCASGAGEPGDCPPGAGGCAAYLTLDFTDPSAASLDPLAGPDSVLGLGRLRRGALLDEVAFFVASDAGEGPSYLASARALGGGRYAISRAAGEVADLQVSYGLAEQAEGAFLPAESDVASPSVRPAARGADRWWPNRRGEPLPSRGDLVDAFGEPLLRLVRVTLATSTSTSASGPASAAGVAAARRTLTVAPRSLGGGEGAR